MPKARTKQAAARAAARASAAPSTGMINFRPHSGISGWTRTAWKVSHSEAKPFSGGRPAIAAHPVRNASDGARHAMDQAAHGLHVALTGGVQHRAGAEEQQAFEDRVVERVEQRGGQGEGGSSLETPWRGMPGPGPGR